MKVVLDKLGDIRYVVFKRRIEEDTGLLLEERYGDIAAALRGRRSLPSLTPERVWHPGLDARIGSVSVLELAGEQPDGVRWAQAWKAALVWRPRRPSEANACLWIAGQPGKLPGLF